MACQDRRKRADLSPELKQHLLKSAHSFSFYQVLRLLNRMTRGKNATVVSEPNLSLSFPASDVAAVRETEENGFKVIANFLGIFGVSSPLPTFYTENLMDDEREDNFASKTFISLINSGFYDLLFQVWLKHRVYFNIAEYNDQGQMDRLFSFLGLIEKKNRQSISDPMALLRYSGLFSQHPRSALGLATILQDAFKGIPVEIIPARLRKITLNRDQRFYLGKPGTQLGQNVMIGNELLDRMGKFRLEIGPVKADEFHAFIPGGSSYEKGALLVDLFLTDPLEYDIKITLKKGEVKTARLGDSGWSSLGISTWLFSGSEQDEVFTIFKQKQRREI